MLAVRRTPSRRLVIHPRRTPGLAEYHPRPGSFWIRFSPLAAWAALLISLFVASYLFRGERGRAEPADATILMNAKDFGAGFSTLMLESFHTHSWSRASVRLDSAVTPVSVQALASRLHLQIRVSALVENRRIRQHVPNGGVLPRFILAGLNDYWEGRVAAVCEAAALLRWAAWEGALLDQTYGGSMQDQLESDYRKSWPVVAKRINRRLEQLGMNDRLDEVYSANREQVAERCWRIDEALERQLTESEGAVNP